MVLEVCSVPKRRPAARKSFARRRVKRYTTKFGRFPFSLRVKVQLDRMTDLWSEKSVMYVDCEEPTMAELEAKGVPSDEWRYYLGYMKRMLSLYRTFTGATLLSEKESLIAEYVYRGYNQDVLEQVQEVAAKCAFVPEEEIGTFEFLEYWNFGPPSVWVLQHSELWNYPDVPTLTLLHSELWSA